MHKVDSYGHVNNEFSNGNPGLQIPRTRLEQKWLNTLQRETVQQIIQAGVALDASDDHQLSSVVMLATATIATLRACPVPSVPAGRAVNIFVRGLAADGDGSGGFFRWVFNSTTADDGASIIMPTAISSGPGRWHKVPLLAAGGSVGYATNAGHATSADSATNATHATSADSATSAANATNAGHASVADFATNANTALNANHATNADAAINASYAASAGSANTANTANTANAANTANTAANANALGGIAAAAYLGTHSEAVDLSYGWEKPFGGRLESWINIPFVDIVGKPEISLPWPQPFSEIHQVFVSVYDPSSGGGSATASCKAFDTVNVTIRCAEFATETQNAIVMVRGYGRV